MTRILHALAGQAAVGVLLAGGALAQAIIPPNSRKDPDIGCLVQGLDDSAGEVLKLRAGPGTGHPIIGGLRNGDTASIAAPCQGRWCYVENGVRNGGKAAFRGWIHDGWCQFYP